MNLVKRSLAAAISSLVVLGLAACGREEPGSAAALQDQTTARSDTSPPPAAPSAAPGTATTDQSTTAQAAGALDDAAITAKVKTAFVAEPDLKALQINVDTKNGTVTLSGQVDSEQHKEHAAQVAQGIEGVKAVDNKLTVKAPAS